MVEIDLLRKFLAEEIEKQKNLLNQCKTTGQDIDFTNFRDPQNPFVLEAFTRMTTYVQILNLINHTPPQIGPEYPNVVILQTIIKEFVEEACKSDLDWYKDAPKDREEAVEWLNKWCNAYVNDLPKVFLAMVYFWHTFQKGKESDTSKTGS